MAGDMQSIAGSGVAKQANRKHAITELKGREGNSPFAIGNHRSCSLTSMSCGSSMAGFGSGLSSVGDCATLPSSGFGDVDIFYSDNCSVQPSDSKVKGQCVGVRAMQKLVRWQPRQRMENAATDLEMRVLTVSPSLVRRLLNVRTE